MSFNNTVHNDGSINIDVIPSFGHLVNFSAPQKNKILNQIEDWRLKNGAKHSRPAEFDPSRYASFSVKEIVEEPVRPEHIHEYIERSQLSRRLGF